MTSGVAPLEISIVYRDAMGDFGRFPIFVAASGDDSKIYRDVRRKPRCATASKVDSSRRRGRVWCHRDIRGSVHQFRGFYASFVELFTDFAIEGAFSANSLGTLRDFSEQSELWVQVGCLLSLRPPFCPRKQLSTCFSSILKGISPMAHNRLPVIGGFCDSPINLCLWIRRVARVGFGISIEAFKVTGM